MKKLMTLAAAVVLAAASQAASVSWTATNVYAGNTKDKATGVAYFMTTAMAAVDAFRTDADFAALTKDAYSWTPTTAGTYSVSSTAPVANSTLGLSDATSYTAYLVIFDGATIAESKSFFVTNAKTFETVGGTSNVNIGFMSQKTASQGAWMATTSVPEPTSGLLLLLGMAGLALRRKQA